MLIPLNQTQPPIKQKFALFDLGFRPFFLAAAIFALLSITLWLMLYFSIIQISVKNISLSQWHAHEMIYGYTMAVVAGFLLTAVKNWTGIATLNGRPLMLLFALWCVARVLFLFGSAFLPWLAASDLLFGLMLIVAIAMPIIRVKQWRQLAVLFKLILLWLGNLVFYLSCLGLLSHGMSYAINGAILLLISLILMIGRRVIPFFIERGVGYQVQLKQYKWLDISILVAFVGLFINAIFVQSPYLSVVFAGLLFSLNGYRLFNWHTAGIWHVPLLWSLYLSACLINLAFLFYGLSALYPQLSLLSLHIFTVGGLGLMTLSMMSRVALGHTGRNINQPSAWLKIAFASLVVSALCRALLPMLFTQLYPIWLILAAILWLVSFTIFVLIYTPILIKPRMDGLLG